MFLCIHGCMANSIKLQEEVTQLKQDNMVRLCEMWSQIKTAVAAYPRFPWLCVSFFLFLTYSPTAVTVAAV